MSNFNESGAAPWNVKLKSTNYPSTNPMQSPQSNYHAEYQNNNQYQSHSSNQSQNHARQLSQRRMSELILEKQLTALERQKKAFSAWANTFLSKRSLSVAILSFGSDFSDGVLLCALLEITFQVSLQRYSLSPKNMMQKLDNIAIAMTFLQSHKTNDHVTMLLPDVHDILNKKEKEVLTVLSCILRKLTLSGILLYGDANGAQPTTSKPSLRSILLEWCRKQLSEIGAQVDTISVNDFWKSFQNGVVFCLIIDKMCPNIIDIHSLDPNNPLHNLRLAFETAEEYLGIPPLLTPEEVVSHQADEESVMNYLSMLISANTALLKTQQSNQTNQIKQKQLELDRIRSEEQLKRDMEEALQVKESMFLKQRLDQEKEFQRIAAEQEKFHHQQQLQIEYELQNKLTELESKQQVMDEISQQLTVALEQSNQYSTSLQQAKENEMKWKEATEKWRESSFKWRDTADKWKASDAKKQALIEQLNQEHDAALHNLNSLHADELINNKNMQNIELNKIKEEFERKNIQQQNQRELEIQELKDQHVQQLHQLNAQIYKQYKEYEEILERFKIESIDQAHLNRNMNPSIKPHLKQRLTNLHTQIKYNLSDTELLQSMSVKSSYLMRRRPNATFHSDRFKKLYFVLQGDRLDYYQAEGQRIKGSFALSDYHYVTLAKDQDSTSNEVYLRLTSNLSESANLTLELKACDETEGVKSHAEGQNGVTKEWMFALNTRISLLNYIKKKIAKKSQGFGCPELVHFITDSQCKDILMYDKSFFIKESLNLLKYALFESVKTRLEYMVFSKCEIDDSCVEVIADIVKHAKNLKFLDLSNNKITQHGAAYLAQSLDYNDTLLNIDLENNSIKDDGLIQLAQHINEHYMIQELNLSANAISDNGVMALCEVFSTNLNIKMPSLQLSHNLIGDDGLSAISKMCLSNHSIRQLHLNDNMIGDEGVRNLCKSMIEFGSTLEVINLASNKIASRGVLALGEMFTKLSTPICVDISDNKMMSRESLRGIVDAQCKIDYLSLKLMKIGNETHVIQSGQKVKQSVTTHSQQTVLTSQQQAQIAKRKSVVNGAIIATPSRTSQHSRQSLSMSSPIPIVNNNQSPINPVSFNSPVSANQQQQQQSKFVPSSNFKPNKFQPQTNQTYSSSPKQQQQQHTFGANSFQQMNQQFNPNNGMGAAGGAQNQQIAQTQPNQQNPFQSNVNPNVNTFQSQPQYNSNQSPNAFNNTNQQSSPFTRPQNQSVTNSTNTNSNLRHFSIAKPKQ